MRRTLNSGGSGRWLLEKAVRQRGARERVVIAPARLPRAGADPPSRRRRRSLYTTGGGHLPLGPRNVAGCTEHEFVSVLSVNLENKRNQFSLRSPSRATVQNSFRVTHMAASIKYDRFRWKAKSIIFEQSMFENNRFRHVSDPVATESGNIIFWRV
jgi:hypothetical protein